MVVPGVPLTGSLIGRARDWFALLGRCGRVRFPAAHVFRFRGVWLRRIAVAVGGVLLIVGVAGVGVTRSAAAGSGVPMERLSVVPAAIGTLNPPESDPESPSPTSPAEGDGWTPAPPCGFPWNDNPCPGDDPSSGLGPYDPTVTVVTIGTLHDDLRRLRAILGDTHVGATETFRERIRSAINDIVQCVPGGGLCTNVYGPLQRIMVDGDRTVERLDLLIRLLSGSNLSGDGGATLGPKLDEIVSGISGVGNGITGVGESLKDLVSRVLEAVKDSPSTDVSPLLGDLIAAMDDVRAAIPLLVPDECLDQGMPDPDTMALSQPLIRVPGPDCLSQSAHKAADAAAEKVKEAIDRARAAQAEAEQKAEEAAEARALEQEAADEARTARVEEKLRELKEAAESASRAAHDAGVRVAEAAKEAADRLAQGLKDGAERVIEGIGELLGVGKPLPYARAPIPHPSTPRLDAWMNRFQCLAYSLKGAESGPTCHVGPTVDILGAQWEPFSWCLRDPGFRIVIDIVGWIIVVGAVISFVSSLLTGLGYNALHGTGGRVASGGDS